MAVLGDTARERTETFAVRLRSVDGALPGRDRVEVTILDDDRRR